MNKYLQFMHDAKQTVTQMLEKDISYLLSEISTETDTYSFRFHSGAWDWILNGSVLGFAATVGERKDHQRYASPHSEKFEAVDKAIVSLIKEYHLSSQYKTINAAPSQTIASSGSSVAEEKAKFLKQMETLGEALKSGHLDSKAAPQEG